MKRLSTKTKQKNRKNKFITEVIMKNILREMAIKDAGVLANKYELPPAFISNIIDGELKCSVDAYPFGHVCVDINREDNSPLSNLVRSLERSIDAYVYHCILTDSVLSMLFVTDREFGNLFEPSGSSDYIGVAVVDIDSFDTGFEDAQLSKLGNILVRIA